jgi:hypothetical protein
VCEECRDLDVDGGADVLGVIGFVSLPKKHVGGSMVSNAVLSKEVGISSSDHCIAQEEPRSAMVRVEAIPLPRIVSKNHIGFQAANFPSETAAKITRGFEISVDLVEKDNLALCSQSAGRFTLLFASSRDESLDIGIGIPCPLGAIGQDEVMDETAGLCPFGQSSSASEFDVVGVRTDSKRDCRRRQIDAGDVLGCSRSDRRGLARIVFSRFATDVRGVGSVG